MNAELAEKPKTELTLPQRAAVALTSSDYELKISAKVAASADIVAVIDPAGREQAHRIGIDLLKLRTGIEKAGKDARADATAFSKSVIAEEARLTALITPEETRIMALRDGFDAKIKAEKDALIAKERARVENIQRMIGTIRNECVTANGKSIEWLQERLAILENEIPSADFYEEFHAEAVKEHGIAVANVRVILDLAVAAKADAERMQAEREAEAARLSAERLENERVRAELEALRQEQAKAAAEAAKQAAIDLQIERDRIAEEAHARGVESARLYAIEDAKRRELAEAENARLQLERKALADAQAEVARQQAEINEVKRQQEEAIEAEHARKAHAEGDRLEVEETERTRKSRAEAIATAETDAFYALHPIQFGRNQETAAEMLGDGRGEIPAIETWPEVLFLNANEEGDLLPMLEYDLENVYWTGDSPALSRHIKYIRADLVERLIADAKGM